MPKEVKDINIDDGNGIIAKQGNRHYGVTRRAVLLGLILLPINIYWMSVAELKYDSQATALPLFIYPVFILFLLTVANFGLEKLWKRIAF
ncbi:MAG: DUF6785 family protein, partial [Candidatus Poribacteria bacterium]